MNYEGNVMNGTAETLATFRENLVKLVAQMGNLEGQMGALMREILEESVSGLLGTAMETLSGEGIEVLEQFQNLYQKGKENTAAANQVNEEVDRMFDEATRQWETDRKINIEEDDSAKKKRLALSGYQKHLEMIHVTDAALRDHLMFLVMEFQVHDRMRQITEHLNSTFIELLKIIDGQTITSSLDFAATLGAMYESFTVQIERDIFLGAFSDGTDLPLNDAPATYATTVMDFSYRYVNFYKKMLLTCGAEVESLVRQIGERIAHLIQEGERLSTFSDDSIKSMVQLKMHLETQVAAGKINSDMLKEMATNLKDVTHQNSVFVDKVTPIMDALQFQDRIQHHINNFVSMLFLFQQALFFCEDDEIACIFDVAQQSFGPFGLQLLKKTTTKQERTMIKTLFQIEA